MRRESILLQSSIFCFDFLPPNSKFKYLYTYIKIGDKGGIHILYVYCIEMRSESCNYAFIDWRYTSFKFLKFQNFKFLVINLYAKFKTPALNLGLCLESLDPWKISLIHSWLLNYFVFEYNLALRNWKINLNSFGIIGLNFLTNMQARIQKIFPGGGVVQP